MNDAISPRDGELLSAYLAGDLDDDEVGRLEARLADEPSLAARLETTRVLLEDLRRLDEVEPPAGFGDRLRARLEEEATAPAEPARVTSSAAFESARAARDERRRLRWPALGAVAAGVAGVAVLGALVTGQLGLPGEMAMEAADEPLEDEPAGGFFADEAAPRADSELVEEDAPETAEEELEVHDDMALDAAAPAVTQPLLLDTDTPLDGPDAAVEHLSATPAESLLGTPLDEAEDLAAGFAVAVRRAPAFASGAEPSACLGVVSEASEQPLVVAHVESVLYDDVAAVAYVAVTARSDARSLDRVEAWIFEPSGCATRLFTDITPE